MNVKAFAAIGLAVLSTGCLSNRGPRRDAALSARHGTPAGQTTATDLLSTADAWRDIGSANAQEYYERAIAVDPADPRTHWAHAEYLRQYRGPDAPMLPHAAEEYSKALQLLEGKTTQNRELLDAIDWGLTDLFQRDGLAVLHWPTLSVDSPEGIGLPFSFFSLQYEGGKAEISARDLTSSLHLTEQVMGRPLPEAEIRRLVRSKEVTDWTGRLRVRPGGWPWIDVWWREIHVGDALVNPWVPGAFNDYKEQLWGVAMERVFDAYTWVDLGLRVGYLESVVKTLVDDGPDQEEKNGTWFGDVAVSRVFPGLIGPNKAMLTLKHEQTDIDPGVPDYRRRSSINAAGFKYSIYPRATLNKFVLRSTDVECGLVRYQQEYNEVDVDQSDVYGGLVLRQIPFERLDLAARVTVMEEEKKHSDPKCEHRQIRYSLIPLWRVSDNENSPDQALRHSALRSLSLYAPLDTAEALDGSTAFDSRGYGIGLSAKIAWTGTYRATLLLTASAVQRDYIELNESETQWNVSAKMGF